MVMSMNSSKSLVATFSATLRVVVGLIVETYKMFQVKQMLVTLSLSTYADTNTLFCHYPTLYLCQNVFQSL